MVLFLKTMQIMEVIFVVRRQESWNMLTCRLRNPNNSGEQMAPALEIIVYCVAQLCALINNTCYHYLLCTAQHAGGLIRKFVNQNHRPFRDSDTVWRCFLTCLENVTNSLAIPDVVSVGHLWERRYQNDLHHLHDLL